MEPYEFDNYWIQRGKGYLMEFQNHPRAITRFRKKHEKLILDVLGAQKPFKSVLEVGCGFGRITRLILATFPDIEKYTAIDISPDQIRNAKHIANSPLVEFQIINYEDMDWELNEFDIVLSVELLMHIPPERVGMYLSKMVLQAKKAVVNADWYDDNKVGECKGGYCFIHPYKELYNTNECTFDDYSLDRGHVYALEFGKSTGLWFKRFRAENNHVFVAKKEMNE